MADHVASPRRAASSQRVAELHRLAHEDYLIGQAERAAARINPSYAAFAVASAAPAVEPTDLDVAIDVARQLVDSDQLLSIREALRLLLRALGAEPATAPVQPPAPRCPAAHPEDPDDCTGPAAVTVLDKANAGITGCEHHAARLLASLDGARVYALPDAPEGAAIRVFKAADSIRPFPWLTGAPRTLLGQLSRAEARERGEGK